MSIFVTLTARTQARGTIDLNFMNIPVNTEIIDTNQVDKEITELADFVIYIYEDMFRLDSLVIINSRHIYKTD